MLASIISDDTAAASNVHRLLVQEGLDCPPEEMLTMDMAAAHLVHAKSELVIMLLGADVEHGLAVMAGLRVLPPSRMIAVGPASDSRLVIRALRSGADDYVDQNDLETSLREALPRCRAALQKGMELGRIIAVLAPSGGSGSSTIAVNLGTSMAMDHKQTLLIDMFLEAGDLAALLNIKPTHSLSDLCQNIGRMDESLFRSTLEHHTSGVYLLAAPIHFSDIQYVTVEAVRQILTLARAGFPYVIVDVDHNYRVEQTQVLRQADMILLVLRMDFNSLRNAKRTMDNFDELGLDKAKIRLIINRFGQANEVPASQAEEALGLKIFESIPDDPSTVNRANNNGEPLVVGTPASKIARSIVHLAKNIEGKDMIIQKPKSSMWGSFF